MQRCAGFKRNGEQCTATVEAPQSYCWWHDPANAEQRSRAASKAARSKGNKELHWVKTRLKEVTEGVLAGTIEKGRAAVAIQGLNAYKGAVMAEWETEIEGRLSELEGLADRQMGHHHMPR
jgi:hypothetical protein